MTDRPTEPFRPVLPPNAPPASPTWRAPTASMRPWPRCCRPSSSSTASRGPTVAPLRSEWRALLDEPLPEEGVGAERVLELLRDVVIPRGLRVGHPGFTSWVTTAPSTTAAAGHLAQAVASPQRWWLQPGNHLDMMAVRWLIELLGFPASYVGTFTSGGSTANLVGIGAARQHAGEKLGIDPALDGMAAMPEPRIYASPETHHVVTRAMGVLGLGRANIRVVGLDAERRADLRPAGRRSSARTWPPGARRWRSWATPGTSTPASSTRCRRWPRSPASTTSGSTSTAPTAAGACSTSASRRPTATAGSYDSFAVDPHKWLAAPVGTGLAICRDGELLGRAFTIEPGHYDRERNAAGTRSGDGYSPWSSLGGGTPDWGVDFSTPTRGIAVWAVLKEIGAVGHARAGPAAQRLRPHGRCTRACRSRAGAALGTAAVDRCFRYRPVGWDDAERLDQLNADILAELRREGRSLPSSTHVDGAFAIRACYINPRNDREHVEMLVDDVLAIGRRLAAGR